MNAATILLFWSFIQATEQRHVVYVVDKVTATAEAHEKIGGIAGSTSEHHSAPIVMGEVTKKCTIITFTEDKSVADFILKTQQGASTITNQKGEVLYITPAKTLKNMVKDVSGFAASH